MAPSNHHGQIDCSTPFPIATTKGDVAFDVTSIS